MAIVLIFGVGKLTTIYSTSAYIWLYVIRIHESVNVMENIIKMRNTNNNNIEMMFDL